MKLVITKTFPEGDTDFIEDPENVTLTVDDKVAIEGDWYHDRIEDKIEGFIAALDFLTFAYTTETIEQVSEV
jgi:hypothetical protein